MVAVLAHGLNVFYEPFPVELFLFSVGLTPYFENILFGYGLTLHVDFLKGRVLLVCPRGLAGLGSLWTSFAFNISLYE